MTFSQSLASTLVGTVAGFVFSILLFYLSENWRRRHAKTVLMRNLRKELEFDIEHAASLLDVLQGTTAKVATGEKDLMPYFQYEVFQSFYLGQVYREGYLYDAFDMKSVRSIDEMFRFLQNAGANVNKSIEDFKSGTREANEVRRDIEFHIAKLKEYRDLLHSLRNALPR
ncbi:MAG: hypothetical protein NTX53_03405 [candidate division WOR-3 bacterium]|nr:hypothetical protein [candidate division WOR-3 bacterium]